MPRCLICKVLAAVAAILVLTTTTLPARTAPQSPGPAVAAQPADAAQLREYTGVYQLARDRFLYLQLWDEFSGFGAPQLVAFDEGGDVRTLYPATRDRFTAGPGAAVATPVEATVTFQRTPTGSIESLTWLLGDIPAIVANRVNIETNEDVRFANGDVRLAGALTQPTSAGPHPAVILVHGSGAENRDYMLPYAHFLVRHGIAVLGYDKRGVGGSSGDWNHATFDDLAGDVVAAFDYLKTRADIDATQVGLLGISQAGWVMPAAAIRAKGLAFLISLSGAGVPAAETTIDQAQNEMTMTGMPAARVAEIVALLQLQHNYARTGNGWEAYSAARQQLVATMGAAPPTIPGTPDAPYFDFIRRIYFYDPLPALQQLRVPTLAIWGQLDNNILPDKNQAAWDGALRAAGNRDYTSRILPRVNHAQFEAKTGSNAEMPTLTRMAPAYFSTVRDWLASHVKGFQN